MGVRGVSVGACVCVVLFVCILFVYECLWCVVVLCECVCVGASVCVLSWCVMGVCFVACVCLWYLCVCGLCGVLLYVEC